MTPTRPSLLLRTALLPLSAVAAAALAVPGLGAPPMESSSELHVGLTEFSCDAWGGDGDHTPLVLTLLVGLTVHNPSDRPVWVESVRWQLPPAAGDLAGSWSGDPIQVLPGETVAIHDDRWIAPEVARSLEQGVDSRDQRAPERISGEVVFDDGARTQFTPYTVNGRWIGCFEPRGPSAGALDFE